MSSSSSGQSHFVFENCVYIQPPIRKAPMFIVYMAMGFKFQIQIIVITDLFSNLFSEQLSHEEARMSSLWISLVCVSTEFQLLLQSKHTNMNLTYMLPESGSNNTQQGCSVFSERDQSSMKPSSSSPLLKLSPTGASVMEGRRQENDKWGGPSRVRLLIQELSPVTRMPTAKFKCLKMKNQ